VDAIAPCALCHESNVGPGRFCAAKVKSSSGCGGLTAWPPWSLPASPEAAPREISPAPAWWAIRSPCCLSTNDYLETTGPCERDEDGSCFGALEVSIRWLAP
jgi:hypothetical protein